MFFTRFIVGNIFCTVLACTVLMLKRLLDNKVSMRFHYRVWMLVLLSLAIVFLPTVFWEKFHVGGLLSGQSTTQIFHAADQVVGATHRDIQINHLPEAVALVDHSEWMTILEIIWGFGALFMLMVYAKGFFQSINIIKNSFAPTNREEKLFFTCQEKINIRQKIVLLQSDVVKSPLSFGVYTYYIILPAKIINELQNQELEHILLHELMHIRHRDSIVNYILCLQQTLYWCNPLIWFIFSRIRQDREAYCDWAVLDTYTKPQERLNYGYTLLRFARQNQKRYGYIVNDLCGSKSQMQYRVEKIASFRKENRPIIMHGICAILMVCVLASLQLPILAVFSNHADADVLGASMDIDEMDYSSIFGHNKGSAVIYDQQAKHYLVYHLDQAEQRIAPCSTFKIFSALNALEQGMITPQNSLLAWDGSRYAFQEWNHDHDLTSAMQNSVNWYFQNLDAAAGVRELSSFYKKIGYGNTCIGDDAEQYWNGSALKISTLEQVELLQKFYYNEFGFDEANIDAVKSAMLCSDDFDHKLYGKTGTGTVNELEVMGWFIGFVETTDNTYFFAVNLQNASGTNGKEAAQITYSIFDTMGIAID